MKTSDFLIRFAFGGAISVLAALVTAQWGPSTGGLFLAFPAILPASLVFVKQNDGRVAADEDAKGAQLGSLGLVAFALTIGLVQFEHAAYALAAASVAWLSTALGLWWLKYGRQRSR